ncbi:MAG: HAD family phosphatase [Candidatus Bathyarchaeota archaeon]|nr:HAD family phosphatase [Candidatus Termiticorpusculum sp.]
MVKAVIFDWDGTLADTRAAVVGSFQQTLKTVNLEISDNYIERRMGIGAAETFREILRETKQPVDEELVKRLVEDKSQNQINLKNQVQLFQGAVDLLELLQNKVKVGLASMNSKRVIDAIVNARGLGKYFQTIITVEAVRQFKPQPEVFLKCAQQLDTLPSKCIVVEDSLFGVKAAKAAGMECIAVTTGAYSKEELEQENPDIIVENLEQAKFYLLNNNYLFL